MDAAQREQNREKQIGARLRAFREALQIPRTKFAAAIGFGSERLASYEAGRAPLPYGVFKAIAHRYRINPQWLATNQGGPQFPSGYEPWGLDVPGEPRSKFSAVYDANISGIVSDAAETATTSAKEITQGLAELRSTMEAGTLPRSAAKAIWFGRLMKDLGNTKRQMKADFKMRNKVRDKLHNKDILDTQPAAATVSAMSLEVPTWAQLKKQIAQCTSERGQKAALADELGVSRQVLGNWLSADDQGKPDAELTLRLLKWVRDPKRAQ